MSYVAIADRLLKFLAVAKFENIIVTTTTYVLYFVLSVMHSNNL